MGPRACRTKSKPVGQTEDPLGPSRKREQYICLQLPAQLGALAAGSVYELAIVAEAVRQLDYLARNSAHAKTLLVPDGSRPIFNTADKLEALIQLSLEMDDLALQIGREQDRLLHLVQPSLRQVEEVLRRSVVPNQAEARRTEAPAIALEIAILGRGGLNINDPDQKYSRKSLRGWMSSLHLLASVYAALLQIAPTMDTRLDLAAEYMAATEMRKG